MGQPRSSWFSLPEACTCPASALWCQATWYQYAAQVHSGETGEKERQNGWRAVERGVPVRKGLMLATHLPPGSRVMSWPMAIFGSVTAGVYVDISDPCCHQGHRDAWGVGQHLSPFWCPRLMLLPRGPWWSEWPGLPPVDMMTSGSRLLLQGHVWANGPAAVGLCWCPSLQ